MAKKILIVDDDRNLASLLSDYFQEHGFDTMVARDGEQAVRFAHETKPDIIILDILLPLGGGINIYKTLKLSAYTETIPVIFITAYDSEEIRSEVLTLGGRHFFSKPFKVEEMLEKVQLILNK
jgi:two-component system OmpR family response regulator